MALVEQNLQFDIEKTIYETADKVYTGKVDKKTRDFAKRLAKVITDHIKTATVTIDPGIPVTVVEGAGATTGPGTGKLN